MNKLRAIIADDEPNLIRYLQGMLSRLWPELEVTGVANNGAEAISLIREEEPDIAFLDIRMPVFNGLQVAKRVKGECQIVFITAYDEYAIEAFEAAAMDYLLKPVEEPRLQATIDRLTKSFASQDDSLDTWQQAFEQVSQQLIRPKAGRYLSWIHAGNGDDTNFIPVDEVHYFKSGEKYTSVVTAAKEYLIRKAIKELAVELEPEKYWQIHRGIIVNAAFISHVTKGLNGGYKLHLKDNNNVLTVSRRYAHLFKQM